MDSGLHQQTEGLTVVSVAKSTANFGVGMMATIITLNTVHFATAVVGFFIAVGTLAKIIFDLRRIWTNRNN